MRDIVHLWQQTGDVQRRHGNGRASLIRGDLIQRVAQIIRQNRTASSNSFVDVLRQAGGARVNARTMRRTRRQLGFHPVHEQTRPTLTAAHMANRLAYARTHRTDNWYYIIFSDETVFTINNKGRVCWIQRGEDRPQINVMQYPIQVHVWGAIWWSGQSTLWIGTGNINSSVYIDILATHLLPCMPNSARYSLLQNNARPHTANHTMGIFDCQ